MGRRDEILVFVASSWSRRVFAGSAPGLNSSVTQSIISLSIIGS